MFNIITTKDDLYRYIEDALGSEFPGEKPLNRLTNLLWYDAHQKGFKSGHDWADYLESVNLINEITVIAYETGYTEYITEIVEPENTVIWYAPILVPVSDDRETVKGIKVEIENRNTGETFRGNVIPREGELDQWLGDLWRELQPIENYGETIEELDRLANETADRWPESEIEDD